MQRLTELATGAFLETATNVLAFGLPGVGKSHALSAVGHALVEAGHSVLFTPAYAVVQELLRAKRDLDLPRALGKLDLFEVILLDDLGYVQQSPEEAEVLFTLLAERYERCSVMVTSNLVFSQWDRIFRDQMATAVRSIAWCTTLSCSSSTCQVIGRIGPGRPRRHRHRGHREEGEHRGPWCPDDAGNPARERSGTVVSQKRPRRRR